MAWDPCWKYGTLQDFAMEMYRISQKLKTYIKFTAGWLYINSMLITLDLSIANHTLNSTLTRACIHCKVLNALGTDIKASWSVLTCRFWRTSQK